MKKLLMALALLPLMAAAETETIGDITWTYSISDDNAIVEGADPCFGSVVIPPVLGGCPVTSIRSFAFHGCTDLTSVSIPESVVSIYADFTDTKLWNDSSDGIVIVSDCIVGVKGKCPDVLVVNERIRCIADYVFSRCSEIKKIQVDSANAYYKSENDCLISLRDNVLIRGANKERISIPAGVEKIAYGAFNFCRLLKSVTIPIGVKEIGSDAFQACTSLAEVSLPMGLEVIDDWAFHFCSALKILDIPETVKEMWYDFGGCPTLVLKFHGAPPTFLDKGYIWERLGSPILYNSKYEGEWLVAIEECGFTNAKPYMTNGEFSPGETVSIATGLIGYTAKGLPSGLKYNKTTGMITGAATKPTAAEGVIVKFTKSGAETEEMTIIVGPMPKIGVALEGDTDGCKVTGAGAYLVGKKVTLKVTTKKGTAFAGFYKDGEPWPNETDCKKTSLAYAMGKEDVSLVAKFEKEKMSVDCAGLSCRFFTAGVAGSSEGIPLEIETQSGVKSVKVEKLPAGMKYDAKKKVITGAPTKAGDNKVVITVTAVSGAVEKKEIAVPVAAMPGTAVGTFNGFVANGEQRIGTFTLTTTDAGKLTAKVITAGGTVSFSGTCWDSLEDGVCKVTLRTKKGEFMTLALDSGAAWNANQLTGTYSPPNMTGWFDLSAQRNAFGKTWYFTAVGDEQAGWTFAYTKDAKAAALTVTLKADGSTAIAGKLGAIKVSASGYANVGGMREGAIIADFAPVVTVNKVKRALSIHTNLWFDRSNDHAEGAGGAGFSE